MLDPALFELADPDAWGYGRAHFLDNEQRYTKMHRVLRESYGDLAGRRILDLGCSRGQLLARFARYPGVVVEGIEIDPAEAAESEKRSIPVVRHFINEFDGHRMIARLPQADGQFDVVLAGEIVEHIVDTQGFLAEIARVLDAGGALVVTTPNVLWLKYRVQVLAGRYPDCLDYRLRYGDDLGHVRAFGPAQLEELLSEAGFVGIRIVGRRLGPIRTLTDAPPRVARTLDRLADRLPALSDDLVAVARKPG